MNTNNPFEQTYKRYHWTLGSLFYSRDTYEDLLYYPDGYFIELPQDLVSVLQIADSLLRNSEFDTTNAKRAYYQVLLSPLKTPKQTQSWHPLLLMAYLEVLIEFFDDTGDLYEIPLSFEELKNYTLSIHRMLVGQSYLYKMLDSSFKYSLFEEYSADSYRHIADILEETMELKRNLFNEIGQFSQFDSTDAIQDMILNKLIVKYQATDSLESDFKNMFEYLGYMDYHGSEHYLYESTVAGIEDDIHSLLLELSTPDLARLLEFNLVRITSNFIMDIDNWDDFRAGITHYECLSDVIKDISRDLFIAAPKYNPYAYADDFDDDTDNNDDNLEIDSTKSNYLYTKSSNTMNIDQAIERLEKKTEQQYFGYAFNLFIREARTEDGKRDIDKEDFVMPSEPDFSDWLTTFYQDIIEGNVDTKSPYFWERWDYYRREIPANKQPSNYSLVEQIVLPLKKTHGRTAQNRKKRIKQQRINELVESVQAEKNLSDADPQALSVWHEEAIVEAVYNALLLEKSTTRQMVEVKAMSREAILLYLWENQKSDGYTDADYDEVQRIYNTFKLSGQIAKQQQILTNEEVIKLTHELMGDGTDLPYVIDSNHPTVSQIKIKALNKYIDAYNHEKEQFTPLVAIARFYAELVSSKLFKRHHETMLTAIVNLELQKYGYPFIAIRRRDLFSIEDLGGRYHLYNDEPQNYIELILSYVEIELLCIQDYLEDLPSTQDDNTIKDE